MDRSGIRNWRARRNLNLEESEYNEVIQMRRYYSCSIFIMLTTAILVIVLCDNKILKYHRRNTTAFPALERFGKIVLSRIFSWKFWKERSFQTLPELEWRAEYAFGHMSQKKHTAFFSSGKVWKGRSFQNFQLEILDKNDVSKLFQIWKGVCSTDSSEPDPTSYWTKFECPQGAFRCDTDDVCINGTQRCDGVIDCPDKSDEGHQCDEGQNGLYGILYKKRPDDERKGESLECSLSDVPKQCVCKSLTKLYCNKRKLRSVPKHLPWKVSELDIGGNNITSVNGKDFRNLTELKVLWFQGSSVQFIANATFRHCRKLSTVNLHSNKLKTFSSQMFAKRNKVETINLSYNQLAVLGAHDLQNLEKLKELSLVRNRITRIDSGAFSMTKQLETLDLSGNKLAKIRSSFFTDVGNLKLLVLHNNSIEYIEPGSFSRMKMLETLHLSHNKLTKLETGIFEGLDKLKNLVILDNDIEEISEGVFSPVSSLVSLDVTENPFRKIPKETFQHNKHLKYIYFDKFYMCAYVQDVAELCKPHGDGISSQENLLENIVLRICVWVVAVLACAGNIVVLLGRFLLKEDNQIHSFFIKNLSLADMLMGIYLLIIGSRDKMYRGDYMFHDEDWRNSWECDISGILSTVSSEMSVMTLTLITLDRYMSIMYPLSFRRRGLKVAYLAMASLWMMAILLGVIPVLKLDYFGESFYRDNAVCIPLHLHDPFVKGWEYSAILILGVNSVSFGFISYAYAAMFLSIQRTAVPLRTTRESRDRCLVKRFFFIVITDFACWVPIIVIKILALSGIKISGDLYAWVVVFVLPVNSALNPLLYTLTTKLFKQKLFSKFSSVVWRPQTNKETTHSVSSARAQRTSVTHRNAVNEVEMQCLRNHRKINGRLAPPKMKSILKKKVVTKSEVAQPLKQTQDANGECVKVENS